MNVSDLIITHINWNTKIMRATPLSGGINVKFLLSVPAWVNDKDLVKQDNHSVIYAGSEKKGRNRFEVKLSTLDLDYPIVGNNKYFAVTKFYKVEEFLNISNIKTYMTEEREKIFRETRSNIILEQIGELTKKWNSVSEGKYFKSDKTNYGLNKCVRYQWSSFRSLLGGSSGLTYSANTATITMPAASKITIEETTDF